MPKKIIFCVEDHINHELYRFYPGDRTLDQIVDDVMERCFPNTPHLGWVKEHNNKLYYLDEEDEEPGKYNTLFEEQEEAPKTYEEFRQYLKDGGYVRVHWADRDPATYHLASEKEEDYREIMEYLDCQKIELEDELITKEELKSINDQEFIDSRVWKRSVDYTWEDLQHHKTQAEVDARDKRELQEYEDKLISVIPDYKNMISVGKELGFTFDNSRMYYGNPIIFFSDIIKQYKEFYEREKTDDRMKKYYVYAIARMAKLPKTEEKLPKLKKNIVNLINEFSEKTGKSFECLATAPFSEI